MLEDLCRAILTKDNKKYEFVTFASELPNEVQYQDLKDNHIFDFCVKQSFKSSPYMGAVSEKAPEYGFYRSKEKCVYDRYFSKEMKLEELLSDDIRECYEPKKTKKTTSGNEFSSGKFYSVASSSRLAVTSFSQLKNGVLNYIETININNIIEKISEIEFEHDTPINGINIKKHCPQMDVFLKTNKSTYFIEVKNHEILNNHKSIKLSPSYINTEPFKQIRLQKTFTEKIKKDKKGNDTSEKFISLSGNNEINRFLLASDFGCNLETFHFDLKQFICHLMGIWSYSVKHPEEEIFFYYLIYRNKLYEDSFNSTLYKELETEAKIIFAAFEKHFPQIQLGLCYNDRYDTLTELKNVL